MAVNKLIDKQNVSLIEIGKMWHKFPKLNREKLFLLKSEVLGATHIVSTVSQSYLHDSQEDNCSLYWTPIRKSMITQFFGQKNNVQVGLNIPEFAIEVLVEEIVFEKISLEGRNFKYITDVLKQIFQMLQMDSGQYSAATSQTFTKSDLFFNDKFEKHDKDTLLAFSCFYQNALLSFKKFGLTILNQNIKTIIDPKTLELFFDFSIDEIKKISIGINPGNNQYPEPFFFISPSPYPKKDIIAPLNPIVGQWHISNWTALILLAHQFILETEHLEELIIFDFLRNAFDLSKKSLLI